MSHASATRCAKVVARGVRPLVAPRGRGYSDITSFTFSTPTCAPTSAVLSSQEAPRDRNQRKHEAERVGTDEGGEVLCVDGGVVEDDRGGVV